MHRTALLLHVLSLCLFLHAESYPLVLPTFPTRRSSDLDEDLRLRRVAARAVLELAGHRGRLQRALAARRLAGLDRKSTRLNSSHVASSYAVCCSTYKITQTSPHRSSTNTILRFATWPIT